MKEISYQVFDEESGLPFETMSDERVRTTADKFNKSYSEVFADFKESVESYGVKYEISSEERIIPILTPSYHVDPKSYYNTYSEAIVALKRQKASVPA